jgi:hypothetical protein
MTTQRRNLPRPSVEASDTDFMFCLSNLPRQRQNRVAESLQTSHGVIYVVGVESECNTGEHPRFFSMASPNLNRLTLEQLRKDQLVARVRQLEVELTESRAASARRDAELRSFVENELYKMTRLALIEQAERFTRAEPSLPETSDESKRRIVDDVALAAVKVAKGIWGADEILGVTTREDTSGDRVVDYWVYLTVPSPSSPEEAIDQERRFYDALDSEVALESIPVAEVVLRYAPSANAVRSA